MPRSAWKSAGTKYGRVRIKKKQIGKEMECRRADPIRVGPFFAYAVFGIDCFNKNLYMVLSGDLGWGRSFCYLHDDCNTHVDRIYVPFGRMSGSRACA